MAQLDDGAYVAQMEHLSAEDRGRVKAASRTGAALDDPRLDVLASETTRRDHRSAGMLCLLLLAQATIVALYIGNDTGVLPAWAVVAFVVVCAGFSVFNGLRWWRLHRVPPRDPDPLTIAAMQREASRLGSGTAPDADDHRHPDDNRDR